MPHLPKILGALSRLLSYPDQHTGQTAELLYVVLQEEIPDAAKCLSQFGTFVEQHEPYEVEEAFTSTFDVNPACALEVGWHLFGEEYARGLFLVRMREELRKYDLPESTELPDHISHVLAIVALMPDDEATRFVQACVQPAVETMHQALEEKETPYRFIVACLALVIRHRWGLCELSGLDRELESRAGQPDLLHAFPVAGVELDNAGLAGDCSCGPTCIEEMDVVPLNDTFSGNKAKTRTKKS